jgi:cystathionine beta-lyase/cystathionine gamma-synthase
MSNFSHFATKAIHVGSEPDQWKCHAVVPPIFLSTTFEEQEPAVTYVMFSFNLIYVTIEINFSVVVHVF